MFAFFLTDFVLSERIGIGLHVAVVDGLVAKCAQLAQVLGDSIHTFPLLTQPRLKVLQHGISQVGEVQPWAELLKLGDSGQQVFLGVWPLVRTLDGCPGECQEGNSSWRLLSDSITQQGECWLDAPFPKRQLNRLQVDDELE